MPLHCLLFSLLNGFIFIVEMHSQGMQRNVLIVLGVIALVIWSGCLTASPPNEVVCTTDAKICPDGTGVGRVPPACEFAPCPAPTDDLTDDVPTPTKLLSHETLIEMANCTALGMQPMYGGIERAAYDCPSLPATNIGNFADGVTFYSDPTAYGFDFSALTYYVAFTVDEPLPVLSKDCIQVCGGPRLMAYINGNWVSINTPEALLNATGTIDSESEALAYARYVTGSITGEEVPIEGFTSLTQTNADESFVVELYTWTGGITNGTDYLYYRVRYKVTPAGEISEVRREQVGIVPNTSIA